MHLVSKNDQQVREAIDQCKETGYEALILSFGSHCNMEDTSAINVARWKMLAEYAHQNGILIGSYSLFSSRRIDDETDVIDPKTGKQVKDKSGILQYKPVTTTTTTTSGEGFTAAEQQAFLAVQLVSNFPNEGFDEKTIGGAAKAIYDELVATNRNNYNTSPKFSDLLPVIKDIVGAKTPELGKDALEKYKSSVRNDVAVKYMSLAEDAANGIDANKYVGDLLDKLSITLESPVDINDQLAIQLLNFQAPDGTYRKANEYEIGQAIMNDKRFQTTSAAINQAVNVGQALKSALGR